MTIDSLLKPINVIVDSVKYLKTELTTNLDASDSNFDYKKTLLVALIGAAIGQALIIFIQWIKSKIDLRTKKRLILTDLNNQKLIIVRLKKDYEILLKKFEEKNLEQYTYDAYEDLHSDIYNSIVKTDLYKIFGNEIITVVKIYKTLEFLERISLDLIYNSYITKLDNHLREKRDKPEHKYFCATHIGYLDTAIIQLKENIKTSQEVTEEIEAFVNKQ